MCVKTLSAWRLGKKPNGKDLIVFRPPANRRAEFIQISCGQCMECRLLKAQHWAVRCMHESSSHEDNCFITLTFNDEFLDPVWSLRKHHFRNFMKRLRKAVGATYKIRYFHAAEYGSQCASCSREEDACVCSRYLPGRPHHHAIIFGFDFPDKKFKTLSSQGHRHYESELLTKLWSDPVTKESYGFHDITSISFEACAYVARYCVKKVNGSLASERYEFSDVDGKPYMRLPEFCTMSRRPGIAFDWYEKYKHTDVFAHDKIVLRDGKEVSPPRYYSNKYEESNPLEMALIKEKRVAAMLDNPDRSFERQRVREKVKHAQNAFLKRRCQ